MKNVFSRLKVGVRRGHSIPTLPSWALAFYNHILIRIFRVLRGLSFLYLLSKNNAIISGHMNQTLNLICLNIASLFCLVLIIAKIIRTIHIIKILKGKDLDIKNSPYDRFASLQDYDYLKRFLWKCCSCGHRFWIECRDR